MEMIARATKAGEVREIAPEVALSHVVGMILNVPRLIHEGTLAGPALKYADEVATAAWRVLCPAAMSPAHPKAGCSHGRTQ